MLLLICNGVHNNALLTHKTGSSLLSIVRWKHSYLTEGYTDLINEIQGGHRRWNIDNITKKARAKLYQFIDLGIVDFDVKLA